MPAWAATRVGLLALALAVLMVSPSASAQQQSADYVVRSVGPQNLALDPPQLPSIAGFTRQAALRKIVRTTVGTVEVARMVELEAFDEFVGGDGRLQTWAQRQRRNPVAVVLTDGKFTLSDIAAATSPDLFEMTAAGVYLARVPVLVKHSATLVIDRQVRRLKLSRQGGAFLVNDGRLFIVDSELIAWDEQRQAPARYVSKKSFRPFLVSWGGSQTYLINSRFISLGYGASKSYGISFSQYSKGSKRHLVRSRPTGWIIDSHFDDLLYGFYCYEADDVAIIGSTYANNIVYGIDPHDRSERLIIAKNTAYGTKERHGIIVSREVNNSWIFDNESFDNTGSGIMLDRQSTGNVVANNKVHGNGSDGVTVYESPKNLLYANESIGNHAHGFRVRNSVGIKLYENIAVANRYTGINGHVRDLGGQERDLQLDPYDTQVSMVVVGGKLIHNGGGPIAIDQPISIELFNVDMLAPAAGTGVQMSGVLGEHLHTVLDLMVRQKRAVIIEPNDNVVRQVDG